MVFGSMAEKSPSCSPTLHSLAWSCVCMWVCVRALESKRFMEIYQGCTFVKINESCARAVARCWHVVPRVFYEPRGIFHLLFCTMCLMKRKTPAPACVMYSVRLVYVAQPNAIRKCIAGTSRGEAEGDTQRHNNSYLFTQGG